LIIDLHYIGKFLEKNTPWVSTRLLSSCGWDPVKSWSLDNILLNSLPPGACEDGWILWPLCNLNGLTSSPRNIFVIVNCIPAFMRHTNIQHWTDYHLSQTQQSELFIVHTFSLWSSLKDPPPQLESLLHLGFAKITSKKMNKQASLIAELWGKFKQVTVKIQGIVPWSPKDQFTLHSEHLVNIPQNVWPNELYGECPP
jgi:hypothetical protein